MLKLLAQGHIYLGLITFNKHCLLSDPSPIIGYACHSLTDSLTDSCLVNLLDVTLACEDANSKLVEVVTAADVDAEDRVGHKANLLFRL